MMDEELNKLCHLCTSSSDEELSCPREADEIQRLTSLFNFEIDEQLGICENCFCILNKFAAFSEQCMKAKEFFEYLRSLQAFPDDLESIRIDMGLRVEKVNQSTDTSDLKIDVKNEVEFECQRDDESDDMNAFEELENFEEISTIELTNDDDDGNECNEMTIEVVNLKEEHINDDNDDEEDCDYEKSAATDNSNKTDINSSFDFSCHLCDEKFAKFFPLQSHCRNDHQSCPEVLCPCCGITLKSRVQLSLHKKMHNLGAAAVHTCKFCKKTYSRQHLLSNHVRISHSKADFTCSQCQKCFDNMKKLKAHEHVHLPRESKFSSTCPYCDKKFTKSVNVQAHIRSVHQQQRPFLCCDCGKDFTTKGALKEHQIIHSNEAPFLCRFCDKRFKNQARKKTHEDIHNTTQYICNICGISLNTKRTLKMHMVVHSDQKRFKCQFCGSSFKRSKALKNHLILHSGLRPYACMWCDKTFANGSNFRSHKKKSHPAELAAAEAVGKATSAGLSIPRLDQLQPKSDLITASTATTSDEIIHQQTSSADYDDIKQELPPLMISSSDSFPIHHIIQSSNSVLIDSQTQ